MEEKIILVDWEKVNVNLEESNIETYEESISEGSFFG